MEEQSVGVKWHLSLVSMGLGSWIVHVLIRIVLLTRSQSLLCVGSSDAASLWAHCSVCYLAGQRVAQRRGL